MYISAISIKNFRMLKDFDMKVNPTMSVIIGRNNTGKTSLFAAVEKFLIDGKIDFYDINIDFREKVESLLTEEKLISEEEFIERYKNNELAIAFSFRITYTEDDDLACLSEFITDLDADNKTVSFDIKFMLTHDSYVKLFEKVASLPDLTSKQNYIKKHLCLSLVLDAYSYYLKDVDNRHTIKPKDLTRILNIKVIKAPRDFAKNNAKTLSDQSAQFFKLIKKQDNNIIENFESALEQIDTKLNEKYKDIYQNIFEDIKNYIDNENIVPRVVSELSGDRIIEDSTVVKYKDDLPEYYNGLGYQNLISILFDIHIYIKQAAPIKNVISLLLIEEPEAHTHPQLQYIFIKNIKKLLENHGLQGFISSHSAHIVSQADFSDLKYFYIDKDSVKTKDLSQLQQNFKDDIQSFTFLKKYLTVGYSELFFADKAVFIEGDTERILFPAFLKKLSLLSETQNALHTNISVIPIGGAYAHKMKPFIDFFNIKTLIITDIDYDQNGDLDKEITNKTIKKLLNKKIAKDIIEKGLEEIETDKLYLAYQKDRTRSFEDSFWEINKDFINTNKDKFTSLKNIENLAEYKNKFEFADNFVIKKSNFAGDILYFSDESFSNWEIPEYIRKGLTWLIQ